jgi:hypothetical protein
MYNSFSDVADAICLPRADVLSARDRLVERGWIGLGFDTWALAWRTPFAPQHRGYIYAIEFSGGVTKVGRTASPRKRLRTHARDAARFSITLTRAWVSAELDGTPRIESGLLLALRKSCKRSGGNEYFVGAMDQAVDLCDGLPCDVFGTIEEVCPCI